VKTMKNKQTETRLKSGLGRARHLMSSVLCLGALTLICLSAPAQNLFVTGWDGSTGVIYEFAPDGTQSTFASGLSGPVSLAFDSAGNLFVADITIGPDSFTSGAIYKFTPDGMRSTFALGLDYPGSLAFDSADNLFVADNGSGILKFTPEGVRTTFAAGLGGPIAFDGAGDLFVANYSIPDGRPAASPYTIFKFTPNGMRSTFASGHLSTDGFVASLAIDRAGNLYLVDGGEFIDGGGSAIYKFTPGGNRSTFFGPSQSCDFGSLAIDSMDNLFVTDDCTGIDKFTRQGNQSVFASVMGASLAIEPTHGSLVATPSVSPDGGTFLRRVTVTLTDITPGTTIYYTLDGSDPTTASLPYRGALRLRHSATVKTMAVGSSGNESGIATAPFTINGKH